MKQALIIALILLALAYVLTGLTITIRRMRATGTQQLDANRWGPSPLQVLIGFVTNFFDTLGIGSFAPTTAWYRHARLVPDELIPGTMNVGHTLPVMLMAYLYINNVTVDPTTLLSMIGAAVVGAWFGAGVVSRLPKSRIQLGMGMALLTAAVLMSAQQIKLDLEEPLRIAGSQFEMDVENPPTAGLDWPQLTVACLVTVMLGALNTIGVGLYAPCMILVSLMGMNPRAAFPIMMGACAFLMPVASTRFLLTDKQELPAALGLTLGGLPAVLIAALIVKELPLYALKWLVVIVVTFTAVQMLMTAWAMKPKADSEV